MLKYSEQRVQVTYIRQTLQRLNQFEHLVKESYSEERVYAPKIGNITRWSSDYEAIKQVLRFLEEIDTFTRRAINLNWHGESVE